MPTNFAEDVSWMYAVDMDILGLLEPQDLELKPGHIHRNALKSDGSRHNIDWIRERVYELEERGLLEVVAETRYYGITDLGKRVARDEISVADLEEIAGSADEE